MITTYGIVVFTEISGELVDSHVVADFYRCVTEDHVWGYWRAPTLEELVRTWPAKMPPVQDAKWWRN